MIHLALWLVSAVIVIVAVLAVLWLLFLLVFLPVFALLNRLACSVERDLR